jgi:hypothetical protein
VSSGQSLRVVLLSEDGSRFASDVLKNLVKHLLRRAFLPSGPPPELVVLPPNDGARQQLCGNKWKKPGKEQIELTRTLATELLKGDVFVFVHLDGDSAWSKRQSRPKGGNRGQWETSIEASLRLILQGKNNVQALDRLLIIEPFYSVEAWLFQNTAALRQWYKRHQPQATQDLARISEWEADPSLLDEIEQIKDQLRIGNTANLELIQDKFPSKKLFELGLSFHTTALTIQRCQDLKNKLKPVLDETAETE